MKLVKVGWSKFEPHKLQLLLLEKFKKENFEIFWWSKFWPNMDKKSCLTNDECSLYPSFYSVYLSFCLSIILTVSFYPSIALSSFLLPIEALISSIFFYPQFYLFSFPLSITLSIFLSIHHSLFLSFYLPLYLSFSNRGTSDKSFQQQQYVVVRVFL